MTSNVGKWSKQYRGVVEPLPYGDSNTYRMGAKQLADCPVVEDWGCGLGWFRQFLGPDQVYRGVDGTLSQFSTVVADLTKFTSDTPGLFMRHVLEHDTQWDRILNNALSSFTKRMVLVIFTPFARAKPHKELRFDKNYGVPTLGLNYDTLVAHFKSFTWTEHELESPETYYRRETVFVLERP